MVSTRRQKLSKEAAEEDGSRDSEPEEEQQTKPDKVEEEEGSDDDAPAAAPSSQEKNRKLSSRELRKQQRDSLRKKNLGLISIDKEDIKQPTKIVFGDDDDNSPGEEEYHSAKESVGEDDKEKDVVEDDAPEVALTTTNTAKDGEDEDADDDDDAVEQVDSNVARDKALAERQIERETRNTQATKKKRKRKPRKESKPRKKALVQEGDSDHNSDDDDLQEDFFAELEAQKTANKKSKRAKPGKKIPKHTIFQTAEDEPYTRHGGATPMEVNPGMELVVLGGGGQDDDDDQDNHHNEEAAMSIALMTKPSETAMFHSRQHILDGSDVISAKQKQKQKKIGMKPPEPTWKRSKKMNRLLFTKGHGKPATNFVVSTIPKTYKF